MQTLQGIRFLPVFRLAGTQLGLDARWLGLRGLGLLLLLTLATPSGPLNQDARIPWWVRLCLGLSTIVVFTLCSLGHELGHALAGRLAGLTVRAVVLAPQGGLTIREGCDKPCVNFRTALAGPLANAVLGTLCLGIAVVCDPLSPVREILTLGAILQLVTALANLVPWGPLDGRRMVTAWRAL